MFTGYGWTLDALNGVVKNDEVGGGLIFGLMWGLGEGCCGKVVDGLGMFLEKSFKV